jgi:hypothetical protein
VDLGANHGYAGGHEIFLIQAKLASPSWRFPYHTLSCGACPALAAVHGGAPAASTVAHRGRKNVRIRAAQRPSPHGRDATGR